MFKKLTIGIGVILVALSLLYAAGSSINGSRTIQSTVNFCADAGGSDSYACNMAPALAGYIAGSCYTFKANTANTGAASIAFNGLSAITIVKVAGGITTTLANNDILSGQYVNICYDGTNMQMQSTLGNAASSGSGLTLVEQHTASNSAALNFTTCISSTYDEYQIEVVNAIPATGDAALSFQVSTDGGSTYVTTNSYSWETFAWTSSATGPSGSTATSGIQLVTANQAGTAFSQNGTFHLYNPGSASNDKVLVGIASSVSSTQRLGTSISGRYEAATAVNAFRVLESSGNITSGTVRCYGLSK